VTTANIADLRERTLALLSAWIAIPSVTGDRPALGRMAQAVATHLHERLGAEIIAAGWRSDPPIVHARIDRGAAATILLYNMYDVMPATAERWSVPPFVGGVIDLPPFGRAFVGRGAENNKGPLVGMLVALEELLAADALPANVEILVEGEEESGSTALRRYLLDPATPVRRSTAALFPSFCEYGGGPPRIYLGTKGIAHGRIRVAGGAWGGPTREVHSSNAPWIANPAWQLVAALGKLQRGPGGFLDRVALPDDARPVLEQLANDFDVDAELRFRSTARYAIVGSMLERLEAVLTTTSLNLAGLATQPPGGRAIIPAAAEARFDLRLPPGVVPEAVLSELRATLAAADPGEVELLVEDAYPDHRFPMETAGVTALRAAYRSAGIEPQIWPWAIGAMPAYAFANVADGLLIGGLGRGGNAHGVDEFVTLAGIDRFLASLLAWLPATVAGGPR
jgi:acetylornithine deacetylase/succinyl-diaminopimelate desuccinylase-like protein